ncbi:TatD DNase family protein [Planifilum fulgidum]|uniref:TatD DNase family protein n=1 Tax=Planifilum fulgidum TaxID=201973 RepID=A0A1I2SGG3_9BACL|nr:TatD family hydrolase [Planifilum fulgidum]MBO2495725.1 TatD family deoxyribonuclease [Bacillota bacterium]SFG51888.1 TatD DNase family protein [Planifilum fulgidum]
MTVPMDPPIQLIDTHVHFDRFSPEEVEAVVRRAREAGVYRVIAVAMGEASCHSLLRWKERYPDFLEIAFGVHPEEAADEGETERVLKLIRRYRGVIRAVGEVGLPYYSLPEGERSAPPAAAVRRLRAFLDVARELELPVSLHAVHAMAAPALRLLKKHRVRRAVFHWLKAPPNVVDAIVEAGHFVSVTPDVLVRERDRDLVRRVPLTSLVLETDAPWEYEKGRPAEPAWVRRVAEEVARIKGCSLAEVSRVTTRNALALIKGD